MNKDIYLQWIRISTKCNQMRLIVTSNDNLSVDNIAKWKKDYSDILTELEKARFDTLTYIAKCNEVASGN